MNEENVKNYSKNGMICCGIIGSTAPFFVIKNR